MIYTELAFCFTQRSQKGLDFLLLLFFHRHTFLLYLKYVACFALEIVFFCCGIGVLVDGLIFRRFALVLLSIHSSSFFRRLFATLTLSVMFVRARARHPLRIPQILLHFLHFILPFTH